MMKSLDTPPVILRNMRTPRPDIVIERARIEGIITPDEEKRILAMTDEAKRVQADKLNENIRELPALRKTYNQAIDLGLVVEDRPIDCLTKREFYLAAVAANEAMVEYENAKAFLLSMRAKDLLTHECLQTLQTAAPHQIVSIAQTVSKELTADLSKDLVLGKNI